MNQPWMDRLLLDYIMRTKGNQPVPACPAGAEASISSYFGTQQPQNMSTDHILTGDGAAWGPEDTFSRRCCPSARSAV